MMRRFGFAILMLLVFATATSAITWDEAVSKADNSNQIQSAKKQADASRWSYYRSLSGYLPQISANAGSSTNYSSSGESTNYSYGISATQPIFKGFATTFAMQSAYAQSQYDQANLNFQKADYYYQLRAAFVDVAVAQQNLEVQKKILAIREDNSRMIKLLYENGKEDQGNYLKTKAQVDEAQYQSAAAKRDWDLAKFRLGQLIDADVDGAQIVWDATLEASVDINQLKEIAPSHQMYKYQLEMAELNKKATVSEFLPSVSLSGNLSNSGTEWPPTNTNKSLSLNFSLPLFNGGSTLSDYAIYSYRLDKAREDFTKNGKDLVYGLKSAYDDLKDALQALTVQKEYLSASTERAKIAQVKYLNGLASYNDWDIIQNEYISYQRNINNYNRSAMLAEANFKKLYGGWIK
jgi:outer membrane protein TolC